MGTRQREREAKPFPVPAPVGGLNARDALAAMPPGDASVLTNLFPYADKVQTRAGFSTHATATTVDPGGALVAYFGFRQLLAWNSKGAQHTFGAYYWGEEVGGFVFPRLRYALINSDGTLTTSREAITTGGTDRLRCLGGWTQFTNAAGTTYLISCVSKATAVPAYTFTPQGYDGSSWSTLTATNVPAGTMGVHVHRNRLWYFGTIDTVNATKGLSAWYLPVGSASAAATEFNVGPYASRGGRIVDMKTWTLDGGQGGTDDLAVFLTDQGQAIVYAGTDPSSSATWQLVGVFDVGRCASPVADPPDTIVTTPPSTVNDSFAMKYGADLLFVLADGVTSAAKVLRGAQEGADYTLSSKIRSLITDSAATYGALSFAQSDMQWKLIYLPTGKQLILTIPGPVNMPSGTGAVTIGMTNTISYAMNTETGAWAKFDGLNMWDAIVVGTMIYFIDGGLKVYKYGTAADDGGTAITYECRQAYNYMNSPNNKLCTMMQPMLIATGNFSLTVQADADFNAGTISAYTSYTVASTSNLQPWLSANKYGRAIAAHLKGQTSAGVVSWYATNWLVKAGGMI